MNGSASSCDTYSTVITRLIAIDVPPEARFGDLVRLLEARRARHECDFSIGVVSIAHEAAAD